MRPNEREARHIAELRSELAGLDPLPPTPLPGVDNIWLEFRRVFRRLFATRDPRAFLQWELTRHAMYNVNPFPGELRAVMSLPDWAQRWRPAIQETSIGRPDRCPMLRETSWNLVRHAFALSHFEGEARRRIDGFDLIVEFGGGYGSMARLAWQLGFRGQYVIYDLPEICAVQRYFLRSLGVPVTRSTEPHAGPVFSWADNLGDFARLMNGRVADLFVATWSLSETPIELRDEFLNALRARHHLIVYADRYCGIDNARYFADWQRRQTSMLWTDWASTHQPGRSYVVGMPRGT